MPEVEAQLRRAIRDERAKDPLITILALQKKLEEQFGHTFKRDYIAKLSAKVAKEVVVDIDRTKIEARLQGIRENFRVMRDRLMKIIYWQPDNFLIEHGIRQRPPADEDVITAVKTVATMELALMQAEVQAGIYRTLEDAREHHEMPLLPSETRNNVIQAFNRWGFVPPGAITRLTERTIEVHVPNTTTAPTN